MIGNRIKFIRNNHNLSMEEFAYSLNISKSNISNYEKEIYLPNVETLIKIANTYNISIDWLLLGKEHTSLSSSELNLISKYNQLSEREKGIIEGRIEEMLSRTEDRIIKIEENLSS